MVQEEKNQRDIVQEAIESDVQYKQNMLGKSAEKQTNYFTLEYQKLLETLVQGKERTDQFDEAKMIGPLFWKDALVKAGLREKDTLGPKPFESQLRFIECTSCTKCFARAPISNEGNILPSKPPCTNCFFIRNVDKLNQHKTENHRELSPYICKECFLESDTWDKYVDHMKIHLRYASKCNDCIYAMMNKPFTVNITFLCDICQMSFHSDDELYVHHLQAHLE